LIEIPWFETALGKQVKVEVVESLRRGGKTCHFVAHVARTAVRIQTVGDLSAANSNKVAVAGRLSFCTLDV